MHHVLEPGTSKLQPVNSRPQPWYFIVIPSYFLRQRSVVTMYCICCHFLSAPSPPLTYSTAGGNGRKE